MVVDMLHNLLIMIRCTRNTHKNCKPVRNALLDNFKNVLHAYTTNSEIDGVRYCVVGKAIVKNSDMVNFEKKLGKLHTKSGKISVDKLSVYTSN